MTINIKELEMIVKDYQQYFPGWEQLGRDAIFRDKGPILQGILFNRASWDVYRPTAFIRILSAPKPSGVLELPQPLRYPNGAPGRSISLQRHGEAIGEVVRDLRSQIKPSLDRPLNPEQVLDLYIEEAVPSEAQAYSIASLHAYLGMSTKAREWCAKYMELHSTSHSIDSDDEIDRGRFMKRVMRWLEAGEAREQLERVVIVERQEILENW